MNAAVLPIKIGGTTYIEIGGSTDSPPLSFSHNHHASDPDREIGERDDVVNRG
jgi:hypothetical protein